MLPFNKKVIGLLLIALFTVTPHSPAQDTHAERANGAIQGTKRQQGAVPREPTYEGKTLDFWIRALRERDEANMLLAFDAIRSMGPDAWTAVPELTRVVSAPFTPINLGKDSEYAIATKLYEIALRSEAIDALAIIGEAASPATMPVIHWALAIRVVPPNVENNEAQEMFVDLVTLDVEYRMTALTAVQHFGSATNPIVERLLKSSDAESRKIAVLILGTDVLPIVTDLLNSNDCEEQQLGTKILGDMGPFVAKAYLAQLKQMAACEAKLVSKNFEP
jgi:hypothetical protein